MRKIQHPPKPTQTFEEAAAKYGIDTDLFSYYLVEFRKSQEARGLTKKQRRAEVANMMVALMYESACACEEAATNRDLNGLLVAQQQHRRVLGQVAKLLTGQADARIQLLESHRESGRKAKGNRKSGHDWDAICRTYDQLMSEGKKRATVTNILSNRFRIRKDVLCRGLRERGRGKHDKKVS